MITRTFIAYYLLFKTYYLKSICSYFRTQAAIAPSFLEEDKRLAQTDNLKAAIAIFRRAQQLDPEIDLNPETKKITEEEIKSLFGQ